MGQGANKMIIDLSPDYNLFLNIILVLFVLTSVINIIVGLAGLDKNNRKTYGLIEVVSGIVGLLLVACVVF